MLIDPVVAPIIAVFTKYDLLVSRLQRELSSNDVKKPADAFVENQCVKPLKKAARVKFENIAVSSKFWVVLVFFSWPHFMYLLAGKGYEHTVSNLVALTQSLVEAKFSELIEPSVIAAIAQRVNPGVKIDGCIV